MPAAIAIPIALAAGSATAGIAGAKMSSNANRDAAKTQAQSTDKALQFEKDVYNGNMAAYNNGLGSLTGQATQRLGDLLNRPAQAPATASSVFGSGQLPPGSMTLGQMQQGGAGQPAQSGTVALQSPDGEVRMVRPDAVQKYLAQGARRLQ